METENQRGLLAQPAFWIGGLLSLAAWAALLKLLFWLLQ